MISLKFTPDDAARANDEWRCNCGPTAFAAIVGVALDEAREAFPHFAARGYVNPTMMLSALSRAAVHTTQLNLNNCSLKKLDFPTYGLARIQWEGPWTAPDAPPKWRYRQTHWVGAMRGRTGTGIFDVNCLNNGSGWCSLEDWERLIVPRLVALYPRANGKWHITHAIEVRVAASDLLATG